MVVWKTGETDTEPLYIILQYDPVTCYFYADYIFGRRRMDNSTVDIKSPI